MFCYQCEQSASGCKDAKGVCGKDETTAAMQDLLLYAAKGISNWASRARALGAKDHDVDVFVLEALFTTVTNVNFDADRIAGMVHDAAAMRDRAKSLYENAAKAAGKAPETLDGAAAFTPAKDTAGLLEQAKFISIPARIEKAGEDVTSLQEIVTYGLKGAAAYAEHARILGKENDEVYAVFHDGLDYLTRADATAEGLVGWAMKAGEVNYTIMGMLDAGHTETFGHPEPSEVALTPVKGKAILVSGHDMLDIYKLLEQTEGKGINIYTHGEMMPANSYPGLKKFPHLVGHYGGAWQKQLKEFDAFPGAILMTTNCIQEPRESYKARIFTTGLVGWPGVTHVENKDFTPVIEAALAAPGFTEDAPRKTRVIGFGHNAVMGVADKVIEAIKGGAISHFFLIGGCDGARSGRNYFTELTESAPEDSVILTLGCGKFRINEVEVGTIGGLPRMLDMGQCNDSYSAIQVALALAEAFNVGVNELPLSLVLSWYEQKAVAVLLTLLHLGVKNIRIGPTLPQFVSPAVLDVLVKEFGLMPTGTVKEDLAAMLA